MQKDLVDRLYEKISEEPLRPKVLLARSYAQGHQLLEQICKRQGSVFNVEVQTLRGLLTEKAKLELYRRHIRLLDERQSFWVVRSLMKQLASGNESRYITEEMLKPGIVDKVHRAVTEMRQAAIRSGNIGTNHFTNPDKGNYLKQLLALYENYLRDHSQTDYAGLDAFVRPGADDTCYLTIEPTGWSLAERQMIDRLAGRRLWILRPDDRFYENGHFARNPVAMFRATGSLAEVREGFRRMLAEPMALDRTEIILSDYERYVPVIQSHAELLGLECTLANGLPITFCRAGKAAVGILDWIEEGHPVSRLAEMLRHGEIAFPDERWSNAEWVRLLENSAIGWGKERYSSLLQPERLNEENREQGASLLHHVQKWFAGLPDGTEWNPIRLLQWVAAFVSEYAAAASSDDLYVQAALNELADRYATVPSDGMPMDMAIRYVRDMLDGIRNRVSATPKPGAVHVSSLQNGGWSGRGRTWLAGMDERAWSIFTAQDPLLLDEERAALSADLDQTGELAQTRRLERDSRLALIRGEVWLSYSSYDTGEQKGRSPAFEMLQVLRLQSGDLEADFGVLEQALGEPYSVMDIMHAGDRREAVDLNDAWAALLQDAQGKRKDGWQAVHRTHPELAEGYRAQIMRRGETLTEYDGWLNLDLSAGPAQPEEERSKKYISVSQLEQYATCGLKYYFTYVLKLRPKEAAEFDRTHWLQPNERGSLLHLIFRLYLEKVTEQGTRPAVHDRACLTEITEKVIGEYDLAIPAPSPHVFAKEGEEIRLDVEIFYRKEQGSTDQPCFFELELTLEGEPMQVELPGGIRLRLKGFVDRVDRIGPHQYRIIDYKTGSPNKYKPSEYFSGGTQLQHALYSVAVEQWLRAKALDPEAEVVEADYVFPTERGRGDFVRRQQNRRQELAVLVSRLMASRERGIYIPARDARMCQWCDYQTGCGSHAEWMADKRQAEVNAGVLSMLLEVEGHG